MLNNKYIMVVDDHKQNRELLCTFFRKQSQKYLQARNGEESIKVMSEYGENISLVLMDIRMAKMDGIEAMKKIKARYKVPVIAVTAYAMENNRQELLDEGFDEYIPKPINIYTLNEIILKALNTYRD